MHNIFKSDSKEIMIKNKADEVVEKLFRSLLNGYKINLETLMRGSDSIFDYVHWLYYKCHQVNLNGGGSYTDSPDWIKKQKRSHKWHQ